MADLSSKQLQDFLDSQREVLTDLFYKLENTQKNQNKLIGDSIEKLGQILGQKIERMQNFSGAQSPGAALDKNDINKLSSSLEKVATNTTAIGKKVEDSYQKSDSFITKAVDLLVKAATGVVKGWERSFESTSNQLNFNRQMEVNGVLTTFDELRAAAKNSGVSLDELSNISGKFSKVMISLNAAGQRGVQAFQEIGSSVYNQLQKQNISFTQSETYEVEGVFLESIRRMGRFQELTREDIERQTVNTAKIVDSISKLTGQSRSQVMEDLKKGPTVLTQYGFEQLGFNKEQISLANGVFGGLEAIFGPDFRRALESYTTTDIVDEQVMQQLVGLGGTENVERIKNMILSAMSSSENPYSKENVESLIKNITTTIAENGESFRDIGINPYAVGRTPYLANQLMISQKARMALNTGINQEEVFEATTPIDKEQGNLREKTTQMLNLQADAARNLQTASNEARDALMSFTASVKDMDFAAKTLLGNYKDLVAEGSALVEEFFGKKISDTVNPVDRGIEERRQSANRITNAIGATTNKSFDIYEEGYGLPVLKTSAAVGATVGALRGGANAVKGIKAANEAAKVANTTVKASSTLANTGKVASGATKGALHSAGKALGWASLGIDAVEGTTRIYEGDYEGAAGSGGSLALDAIAMGLMTAPTGVTQLLGLALMGANMFGLGDWVGRSVYDWTTDDKVSDKQDLTQALDKIENDSKTLASNIQMNQIPSLLQDAREANDVQMRQLAALENIDRKLGNGTNLYNS